MLINSGANLTKSMGRNEYESSQRRLCIVLKKMTIWTPWPEKLKLYLGPFLLLLKTNKNQQELIDSSDKILKLFK